MPIVACEPDVFPEDLLDDFDRSDCGHSWWALYTMSRREKDLMRRLHAAEIAFYAPLIKNCKRSPRGRLRISFMPLFPGNVFLHGDDSQRRQALATNCVSRCLPVTDGQKLVDDLRQIRRLIDADVPLTPEAYLEPGRRIRVCSGPLRGVVGIVVKRHGQRRLLVAVKFLQQRASVQIEDCAVESADKTGIGGNIVDYLKRSSGRQKQWQV